MLLKDIGSVTQDVENNQIGAFLFPGKASPDQAMTAGQGRGPVGHLSRPQPPGSRHPDHPPPGRRDRQSRRSARAGAGRHLARRTAPARRTSGPDSDSRPPPLTARPRCPRGQQYSARGRAAATRDRWRPELPPSKKSPNVCYVPCFPLETCRNYQHIGRISRDGRGQRSSRSARSIPERE